MKTYQELLETLRREPKTWLVTGVAGFIGSNLLETLLKANQRVIGLDNFSTGKKENIAEAIEQLNERQRARFTLVAGDIKDLSTCRRACEKVDYVLHQAALGSVPRSIENPVNSNDTNVSGFLNLLVAARDQRVRRVVYASSSAVYGDSPALPKVEANTGRPLSPYAVTKAVNELYADVFWKLYGLEVIGLRYFNVFGPRQDPQSAYAAVIPRWISAMIRNAPAVLHGDGSTSRDFCFVANVVQANLLAATTTNSKAVGQVFNVALGDRTTLRELFELIRCALLPTHSHLRRYAPRHEPFRAGDVRHSQADISRIKAQLDYAPTHTVEQGMVETLAWHARKASSGSAASPELMERP